MKPDDSNKSKHSANKLESLRKKVDALDDKIINLLVKRQGIVKLIGEAKKSYGIRVSNPEREKQILKRISLMGKQNNIDFEFIEQIYRAIFKNSRKVQRSS